MNYLDKFTDTTVENTFENLKEFCGVGYYIIDYSDGYIDEIINGIADGAVDVYNYKLIEFVGEHPEYMDMAIKDGWYDVREYNFFDHCRIAQYYYYIDFLNEHQGEMLELWALNYYKKNNIDIDKNTLDKLFEIEFYNIDNLTDLAELINTTLEN